MKTETQTAETEETNPGLVLERLMANRTIVPVPDSVIEEKRMADQNARIRELRREAQCPDRATRWLRERPDGWDQRCPAFAEARAGVAALMTRVGGATVLLFGPQGTGKTVLAVDAIRTATAQLRRAKFTTAVSLLAELSDAKTGGRLAQEIRHWVGIDVLVIDQFDKLAASDWESRLVFDILDTRHNQERVTLLVANATKETVGPMLGSSLVQRIQEAGAFYNCNWERFRAKEI